MAFDAPLRLHHRPIRPRGRTDVRHDVRRSTGRDARRRSATRGSKACATPRRTPPPRGRQNNDRRYRGDVRGYDVLLGRVHGRRWDEFISVHHVGAVSRAGAKETKDVLKQAKKKNETTKVRRRSAMRIAKTIRVNCDGEGPVSAEWMVPKALWMKRHEERSLRSAAFACEYQST